MSESETNERTNVREQTNESWFSIREASERLKVSERVLQKRAQSGDIISRKVKNRWEVSLTQEPSPEIPNEQTNEHSRTSESDSRTNERSNEQDSGTQEALIRQLQAENAFLRSELTAQREAHQTAESELRRLMAMDKQELLDLRQRVALTGTSGTETGKDTPKEGGKAQRGFWSHLRRFWKG